MKSIVELQALRGLAVMMVVFGHVHQAQERFMGPALLGDMAYVGFAGVDVFFVISGFIIHYLYRQVKSPDASYFLKRLNRIYPLYWLYSALTLLAFIVMGNSFAEIDAEQDLIGSFALIPINQSQLLPIGWTLVHELYFYLVYGLVLFAPSRWRLPLLGLWGAVTLASILFGREGWSMWATLALSPFNLLFLAGVLMAEFFSVAQRYKLVGAMFALFGFALGSWYTYQYGLSGLNVPTHRIPIFAPLAIGTVWAILAYKPAMPAIASKLGDWSYSIYLSHLLVISAVAVIGTPILTAMPLTGLMAYLAFLSASIIFGALSFRLIEKPLLKIGRRVIDKVSGR